MSLPRGWQRARYAVGRASTAQLKVAQLSLPLFFALQVAVMLCKATAQSPDLLFNPHRQRMREPIHLKEDLYPIMCDVCELVAYSVDFDTAEKLKVITAYAINSLGYKQTVWCRRNQSFLK